MIVSNPTCDKDLMLQGVKNEQKCAFYERKVQQDIVNLAFMSKIVTNPTCDI